MSSKCPSRTYNVEDFTYERHCADKARKRMMSLALHPDKNPDCKEEATNKFKTWNAMCEAGDAASVPLAAAASASSANPYSSQSYYARPPPPPPPPPRPPSSAAQQSYDDGSFRNKFAERNAKYGSTRPETYGSRMQTAYRDDPFRGARVRVERRDNNSTSNCSLFGSCRRSGGRSRKLKKGSKKRNTIIKRSRPRKRNTRRY